MTAARILFIAANPSIDRLYELDRLTPGAIHRPELVAAVPGGKGLNAARAAARLGGRVTVVGIVGGRGGDWIREGIAARGIDARWIASARETRTCVSILDRSTGAMTEIYERGEPVEGTEWADLERIVERELATGDVAAVALSGSLQPGAPQDGFARIAAMAGSSRTGARPVSVLADTYGAALAAVLPLRPAVVKVNADEAADATGVAVKDTASADAAARVLIGQGASCVVVTLGLHGAIIATETIVHWLVPPEIRGTYPVGSGDAFLGGMAVGIARGDDMVFAAGLGLAAATANALTPGAGELDPDTADSIQAGVIVRTFRITT